MAMICQFHVLYNRNKEMLKVTKKKNIDSLIWNWPDSMELVSSFHNLYKFMHKQIVFNQINQLYKKSQQQNK